MTLAELIDHLGRSSHERVAASLGLRKGIFGPAHEGLALNPHCRQGASPRLAAMVGTHSLHVIEDGVVSIECRPQPLHEAIPKFTHRS